MSLVYTDSNHRYKLDGKPVTGVTTILGGGIPKPALVWWAPGVVAKFVTEPGNAGKVAELLAGDRDQSIKFLQSLPNKERDSAAERGTEVHDLAEKLATTGEVDAPEELVGFIEGYLDFLDRWQITPVLVEVVLANRKHWYSGKVDLLATSPLLMSAADIAAGKVIQIDLKTSKGVYMETALQTAAYARAEFYMDEGKEVPMPEVIKNFVAHVTPLDREGINERYEGSPLGTSLYPLATSPAEIDEHFQQFLHAKAVHEDAKARGKKKLEPINPPTEMKVAA
ncbi:putative Cas4 family exonuclease [Glutamicibacter phage BIM BV-113]|nr:putative Cas4 family exonuclease [Glutamicibacter phage BIM BV-113]